MIAFGWNPTKARSDLQKHGVSFEEARSVFCDTFAIQFYDEESLDKDRFLLLGMSNESRILVVVHCEREKTGSMEKNFESFPHGKRQPENVSITPS